MAYAPTASQRRERALSLENIYFHTISYAREHTGAYIPASVARELRTIVAQRLHPNSSLFTMLGEQDFSDNTWLQTIDEVLAEHVPSYVPRFIDQEPDPVTGQIMSGIQSLAYRSDITEYNRLRGDGLTFDEQGKPAYTTGIPLSPYDPTLSHLDVFMQGGVRRLAISDTTIRRKLGGSFDNFFAKKDDGTFGAQMAEAAPLYGDHIDAKIGYNRKGFEKTFISDADVMRTVRLRPFMDAQTFEAFSADIINQTDAKAEAAPSAEQMDRAVAVLSYLKDSGIKYTIEKDYSSANATNYRAKIDGTETYVTIYNAGVGNYKPGIKIGHIYDDGIMYDFETDKLFVDRQTGATRPAYYQPTAQDSVNLLRFALGQSVERLDVPGVQVGGNRQIYDAMVDKNNRKVQALRNESSSITSSSNPHNRAQYAQDAEGNRIFMRAKYGSRTERTTFLGVNEVDRENGILTIEDKAREVLKSHITSARENFRKELNLSQLFEDYEKYSQMSDEEKSTFSPTFSVNDSVAGIQTDYWNLLIGQSESLYVPGSEDADMPEVYDIDEIVQRQNLGTITDPYRVARIIIQEHARDLVDEKIGTFEPQVINGEMKRFNPVAVASYMDTSYGLNRNEGDIVNLMRNAKIDAAELKGDTFDHQVMIDKMIAYNPETAYSMTQAYAKGELSPFMRHIYETIVKSLSVNGVELNTLETVGRNPDGTLVTRPLAGEIMMDANGIVRYSGFRAEKQFSNKFTVTSKGATSDQNMTGIYGYIGQIFEPDERGVVQTKFAGDHNYLFVPGYKARVVPGKPPKVGSFESRTRLDGYPQIMARDIAYQISHSLRNKNNLLGTFDINTGEEKTMPRHESPTTTLNGVYRSLADTRHPLDYFEKAAERGLDEDFINRRLATEALRVRYGSEFRNATINAEYRASKGKGTDPNNDNVNDPYVLLGGSNIGLLGESSRGYFDLEATSNGANQGLVRFLNPTVQVGDIEGDITPGDPNARLPLLEHEFFKDGRYDTIDRRIMTFNNALVAENATEPVKIAQMTFGGWTMEDGIVISKEFAEKYRVVGADGKLRPIKVGDKLADNHGNKGVIGLIVDRDMTEEEAREADLEKEVAWFKANPELEMVTNNQSAISRSNGGSFREISTGATDENGREINLIDPETGQEIPGGTMGTCRYMITPHKAEKKTNVYTDEDVAAGKGRKASSQLAWALTSHGCTETMEYLYGNNDTPLKNWAEYGRLAGFDVTADGRFVRGFNPENLNQVTLPAEIKTTKLSPAVKSRLGLDAKVEGVGGINQSTRRALGETLNQQGGYIAVPFPVTLANGIETPVLEGQFDEVTGQQLYALPLLSTRLRSEREIMEDQAISHDYTRRYVDICMRVQQYRALVKERASLEVRPENDALAAHYTREIEAVQRSATAIYTTVTNQVMDRTIMGKRNHFKEGIMSARQRRSATAIFTPDPRLGAHQIGVGLKMAETMGLKNGDKVIAFRDPILRDAGVGFFEVKIDPRLEGVSANPIFAKAFDGDYDGDTLGVMAVPKKLWPELERTMGRAANLLDKGVVDDQGRNVLNMHTSLDVAVAAHVEAVAHGEVIEYKEINPEIAQYVDVLDQGVADYADIDEAIDNLPEFSSDSQVQAVVEQAYITYRQALDGVDDQSVIDAVRDGFVQEVAQGLGVSAYLENDVPAIDTIVSERDFKVYDSEKNTLYGVDISDIEAQPLFNADMLGVTTDRQALYQLMKDANRYLIEPAHLESLKKDAQALAAGEPTGQAFDNESFFKDEPGVSVYRQFVKDHAEVIENFDSESEDAYQVREQLRESLMQAIVTEAKNPETRSVLLRDSRSAYDEDHLAGRTTELEPRLGDIDNYDRSLRVAVISKIVDQGRNNLVTQLKNDSYQIAQALQVNLKDDAVRDSLLHESDVRISDMTKRFVKSRYPEASDDAREAMSGHLTSFIESGLAKDPEAENGLSAGLSEMTKNYPTELIDPLLERMKLPDEYRQKVTHAIATSAPRRTFDYAGPTYTKQVTEQIVPASAKAEIELGESAIKKTLENATVGLNDNQRAWERADLTDDELAEANKVHMEKINEVVVGGTRNTFGAVSKFKDAATHLEGVIENSVDTGAKGSMGKVKEYADQLGVTLEEDKDGNRTWYDTGTPLVGLDQDLSIQYALLVKTVGTGVAGAYSQRGVRGMRDASIDPDIYAQVVSRIEGIAQDDVQVPIRVQPLTSVLELTYLVSQSALQAKKDAEEGRHKYEEIMSNGRSIWRGEAVHWDDAEGKWTSDGEASPEVWVESAYKYYTSPQGLNLPNVDKRHFYVVAAAMTDPETMLMRSVEDVDLGHISMLDRLAYPTSAETREDVIQVMNQMCFEGATLYGTGKTSVMEPKTVRAMREFLAEGNDVGMVAHKDTQRGYEKASRAAGWGYISEQTKDERKEAARAARYEANAQSEQQVQVASAPATFITTAPAPVEADMGPEL